MDRRVVVTGHTGFVGRALSALYPVIPLASERVDMREPCAVLRALEQAKPDALIHLAALSSVAESLRNPRVFYETNFLGTLNLFEGLQKIGFNGRVLLVSSSEVYGEVSADRLPIGEQEPHRPRNPYAVSKCAAELLCHQWAQAAAFDIITARPFNHIGPGQDGRFVIPSMVRQVVEMERGLRLRRMELGDLGVSRDFLDVRDVAHAYWLLLHQGQRGEAYNVALGQEHELRGILDLIFELTGVIAEVAVDPARVRRTEIRRMVGDPTRLMKQTGWHPEIGLRQTLQDMIDHERQHIARAQQGVLQSAQHLENQG